MYVIFDTNTARQLAEHTDFDQLEAKAEEWAMKFRAHDFQILLSPIVFQELLCHLTDGRFDIDNLEAERKIRPFTLGRKNSIHFGSETGVQTATTFYTIIETCKMCGISPLAYLTYVLRQLRDGNRDYEALLPCNLVKVLA